MLIYDVVIPTFPRSLISKIINYVSTLLVCRNDWNDRTWQDLSKSFLSYASQKCFKKQIDTDLILDIYTFLAPKKLSSNFTNHKKNHS